MHGRRQCNWGRDISSPWYLKKYSLDFIQITIQNKNMLYFFLWPTSFLSCEQLLGSMSTSVPASVLLQSVMEKPHLRFQSFPLYFEDSRQCLSWFRPVLLDSRKLSQSLLMSAHYLLVDISHYLLVDISSPVWGQGDSGKSLWYVPEGSRYIAASVHINAWVVTDNFTDFFIGICERINP